MNGAEYIFNLVNQVTRPAKEIEQAVNGADSALMHMDKDMALVNGNSASFAASLGKTALGIAAVATAAMGIGNIGSDIYNTGVQMEQTRAAYAVFVGDVEKSETLFKRLKQFADLSSLTDAEVFNAGKTLLSVADSEVVPEMIRQIADLSAGNADVFQRLTANYAQIRAIGKASLADVKQFGFAGIPIFEELEKVTGLAGEKLGQFISDGGVTAEVVEKIFQSLTTEGGKYFGMTEQMAQTVGGRASTIEGTVGSLYDKIFQKATPFILQLQDLAFAVLPAVEDALRSVYHIGQDVNEWFTDNRDAIEAIGVAVGIASGAYAVYVGWQKAVVLWESLKYMWLMRSVIAESLLTTAQWALNLAMEANPIGILIAALSALGGMLYYAYQTSDTFRAGLLGTWAAAQAVFKGIYDVAAHWLGSVVNLWKGLGEVMLGVIMIPSDRGAMFTQGLADLKAAWTEGSQMVAAAGNIGENAAQAFNEAYANSMAESAATDTAGSAKKTGALITPENASAGTAKPEAKATSASTASNSSSSGSGGSSVRNVSVTINNRFDIAGAFDMGVERIKAVLTQQIVEGVRDAEVITSNRLGTA